MNALDGIPDLLNKLQSPIHDISILLALLAAPLNNIGLLPPQFRQYNTHPLPLSSSNIVKHIPYIQRSLLQNIAPTWDTTLNENNAILLFQQFFCPDGFSNASPAAGEIAMMAYSTILSTGLTEMSMSLLQQLSINYPIDRLYMAAFSRRDQDARAIEISWGDCVRNLAMVPTKVANVMGVHGTIPPGLEHATYFNRLSLRCEMLIWTLSSSEGPQTTVSSITYLLVKLVNIGVFPASPPHSRSEPSFFQATLPAIRSRVYSDNANSYFSYWNNLFSNMPSGLSLRSMLTSFFGCLCALEPPFDDSPGKRARIKKDALLLSELVGTLNPEQDEVWETATSLVIGRIWPVSYARIFVCWLSGGVRGGHVDEKVLETFLQSVLEAWASPEHIKHSLLSQHRYMTSLLLISASFFRPESAPLKTLSFATPFIRGISAYISHLDSSIRHCGMLVGEEIARMCNQKLNFDDWQGEDSGKPWARELRNLLKGKDIDVDVDDFGQAGGVEETATPRVPLIDIDGSEPRFLHPVTIREGYDSDDSLTGYASPASSRSTSPTPSDLADIEADPSLNVGVRKPHRPVYLVQLGNLLRGGGPKTSLIESHEADKIEMALNCAEELIRKKRDYGTELAENAVDLEYALLALQDNFDLPGFPTKRQGALNALIVCAPRQAAPALIEEFFKNQYSTEQRYVVLNALAIGARELASLPIVPSQVPMEKTSFPSKTLPASLHWIYLASGEADKNLIPRLVDDISHQTIEKHRQPESDGEKPELNRERILRLRKPVQITEDPGHDDRIRSITRQGLQPKTTVFTDVAAEFFIAPLINRFWLFLREEQLREERTAHLEGRQQYHGSGTGLILNPLILAQFLRTVGILVNASQNAPEWLAIIAPDSLELSISIGTRPLSHSKTDLDEEVDHEDDRGSKEASVLTAALELALIVLSGCLGIDGGRSLGLEHTTLLLGAGEWASRVLQNLDKGLKVTGGGGAYEARLKRAAVGVLLEVDDLTSRWRRSMLNPT